MPQPHEVWQALLHKQPLHLLKQIFSPDSLFFLLFHFDGIYIALVRANAATFAKIIINVYLVFRFKYYAIRANQVTNQAIHTLVFVNNRFESSPAGIFFG